MNKFTICAVLTALAQAESEPIVRPTDEFVLEPAEPASRDTHSCEPWGKPCDYSSHYYDMLACTCLAQDHCVNVTCQEDYSLDPYEPCGECLPDEKIAGIYPEWATEVDKEEYKSLGILMAQNRPEDWRVCPKENQAKDVCKDTEGFFGYWNELACQCFSQIQCLFGCPEGTTLDPAAACGECLQQSELYRLYYPKWVTPHDVSLAMIDGLSSAMEPVWRVCPFEQRTEECDNGTYWNELACECFQMVHCERMDMQCALGTDFDPMQSCSCISRIVIKEEYYPEWATDGDIKDAVSAGYERAMNPRPLPEPQPLPPIELWVKPVDWPDCGRELDCGDHLLPNELACLCFSLLQCDIWCGEDSRTDPLDGCTCISNDEYLDYFPDWANDKDIHIAQELSYQDYRNREINQIWTTDLISEDEEASSAEMDNEESMVERFVENFTDQGGYGFDVSFTAQTVFLAVILMTIE